MTKKYDISEMRELRKNGLSIRQIAKRTGVDRSTVYLKVRDVPKNPRSFSILGYDGAEGQLYIHLPYKLICPKCGKAQNNWMMCPCHGEWFPLECGCSNGDYQAWRWTVLKRENTVDIPGETKLVIESNENNNGSRPAAEKHLISYCHGLFHTKPIKICKYRLKEN